MLNYIYQLFSTSTYFIYFFFVYWQAESCFPKIKRLLSVAAYVLQNTLVVGERYSFQNGLGILEIIINKLAFKDVIREPEKYCKGVFKSNGSEYHDSDIYIGVGIYSTDQ